MRAHAQAVAARGVLRRLARVACVAGVAAAVLPAPRAGAQGPVPAAQAPSPMVETTRAHTRVAVRALRGAIRAFDGPAGRPVDVLVPSRLRPAEEVDVVIHFHGAAWLVRQAVDSLEDVAAAVVNLGNGSAAYARPFADSAAFDSLLAGIARELSAGAGQPVRLGRVTLVGFSAGYGAVRAILRVPRHAARVSAVLLLDGLHTSYVPEGTPLADGGALDTAGLAPFADFARAAARGAKRMLVTHSEIFPGTYASTTECTDWLLAQLGLRRTPVLAWGPVGMQQLSAARAGGFEVRGYAGNSAPDHVDFLHAMSDLLGVLRTPGQR